MNARLRAARRRAVHAGPPRTRYLYLVTRPDNQGGDYWTWHSAGRWTGEEIEEINRRAAEMAARFHQLIG